jgi:glycosidase
LREKLGYIKDLGFDSIWLSPVYEFGIDEGNDVIDHKKISPDYGTEEDFDGLLKDIQDLGIYRKFNKTTRTSINSVRPSF